jgi:hypothetical protein
VILRKWLQGRDWEREHFPSKPKRDRDLMALMEVIWYCTNIAPRLSALVEREMRKP